MIRVDKNSIQEGKKYTLFCFGSSFSGTYLGKFVDKSVPNDERVLFAFRTGRKREYFTDDYMRIAEIYEKEISQPLKRSVKVKNAPKGKKYVFRSA